MKYLAIAILAVALTGCASNGYNPITGMSTQPGTYVVELDEDGALIESSTVKGGPVVKWTKDQDGAVTLEINHNQAIILDGLLEAIK